MNISKYADKLERDIANDEKLQRKAFGLIYRQAARHEISIPDKPDFSSDASSYIAQCYRKQLEELYELNPKLAQYWGDKFWKMF